MIQYSCFDTVFVVGAFKTLYCIGWKRVQHICIVESAAVPVPYSIRWRVVYYLYPTVLVIEMMYQCTTYTCSTVLIGGWCCTRTLNSTLLFKMVHNLALLYSRVDNGALPATCSIVENGALYTCNLQYCGEWCTTCNL